MTTVRCPRRASSQATLTVMDVLPTPPLPEVTAMIAARRVCVSGLFGRSVIQCFGACFATPRDLSVHRRADLAPNSTATGRNPFLVAPRGAPARVDRLKRRPSRLALHGTERWEMHHLAGSPSTPAARLSGSWPHKSLSPRQTSWEPTAARAKRGGRANARARAAGIAIFLIRGPFTGALGVASVSRRCHGAVAQLVERCVRNAKVRGSNPLSSTKSSDRPAGRNCPAGRIRFVLGRRARSRDQIGRGSRRCRRRRIRRCPVRIRRCR